MSLKLCAGADASAAARYLLKHVVREGDHLHVFASIHLDAHETVRT